jgi:Icc-related predicted phosphoesterase
MRFHFMSDLHLESQEFTWPLPQGDVLLLGGDTCHARCLSAAANDPFAVSQRERVLRFFDEARRNFGAVILVAGNHDHYEGVFEETALLFRSHLDGVTVLDNEVTQVGGVSVFGTTLWSDFEGGDDEALFNAGKRCGEFYFVQMQNAADGRLRRFRPADAASQFDASIQALKAFLADAKGRPSIVLTHHAPSRKSLNPVFMGNGLDGAYATSLEPLIEQNGPTYWIHGHTHVIRRYRIGATQILANCRGIDGRDPSTRGFSPTAHFDL